MDLKKYVTNKVGEPTLRDIIRELESQEEIHELSLSMQPLKRVLRK